MESLLSNIEIPRLDFVQLTAEFLVVVALFFGIKNERRFWPNFMLVVVALQCLFFILFHEGGNVKLFAGIMLILSFAVLALATSRQVIHNGKRPVAR